MSNIPFPSPWRAPGPGWLTPREQVIYRRAALKAAAQGVLPALGDPWAGPRQEALDRTLHQGAVPWRAGDWVPADAALGLGCFTVATAAAAEAGLDWPPAADTVLFALLCRDTLTPETYELLTRPWRVWVGPLCSEDDDPDLNADGRAVARALLAADGDKPRPLTELLNTAHQVGASPRT